MSADENSTAGKRSVMPCRTVIFEQQGRILSRRGESSLSKDTGLSDESQQSLGLSVAYRLGWLEIPGQLRYCYI